MQTKPLTTAASDSAAAIGAGQWSALAAALLGWMFDGAEMGIFSLVGRSALIDLLRASADVMPAKDFERLVGSWFSIIVASFLVGAATGGVLFGWLGDRIGRVRAMTLSVLTYAVFTGLCGVVTSPAQLGVLRFIAALGMGGEWSLGVALVMEVWPNRSRAFMAGLIGAAANVGYLLVAFVGLGLTGVLADVASLLLKAGLSREWVEMLVRPEAQGWRVLMLLGTAPALLTFLIRLFVPESASWKKGQQAGATSHWLTQDLLGVLVGAMGPGMMIYVWAGDFSFAVRVLASLTGLIIATLGYTYPVIRYLQRQGRAAGEHARAWGPTFRRMLLGAGLSGVALVATWGATQQAPSWADKLTNSDVTLGAKYYTQIWSAIGAVVGTIIAALMGDWFGRKLTYALLCIVSLVSLLVLYLGNSEYGTMFLVATFAVGLCTASFYGWLPLYLPELFRTRVRATGQGFSFNFGRIIAAVGTLQAGTLFAPKIAIGGLEFTGGYPVACSAMSLIYLVGLVLICFAPETRGKMLPE